MSEPTITSLAIEVAEMRRDLKTAFSKIDDQSSVVDCVYELATQVKLQGQQLTTMVKELSELSGEIKELKAKPTKRWESIVTQIISLLVALIFGIVIAKIGL